MTNTCFARKEIGSSANTRIHLIMGHGWGQSGAALSPLAETLKPFASSTLIDFPGFGASPPPPLDWGTEQYADLIYSWLQSLSSPKSLIWVGHSFGGRVGLQLASRHPGILQGLVVIAGAGLPRKRSVGSQFRISAQQHILKTAKQLVPGMDLDRLRNRVGSTDYKAAGAMRPILTRVVNEDLTEQAKLVTCPTLLLYGKKDTETPVELGQRLHALIPNSELTVLESFGHLTILSEGRHQIAMRMRRFLERIEADPQRYS